MHICLKKLERAEGEIFKLNAFIEEQIKRPENKATLRARYNEVSKCHEIYISAVPDLENLKIDVSITIGVIAHLLRSSLDNLVFHLALANTGGKLRDPKAIYFPISESAKSHETDLRKKLSELSDDYKKIITHYQPFHGTAGRDDTWCGPYIHQLDLLCQISNSDKHREVVGVSVDPNQFEFTKEAFPIINAWMVWSDENRQEYFNSYQPTLMQVGEIIQRPVRTPRTHEDVFLAGYAQAFVTLPDRRPVIATLTRISKFVRLILSEFENLK